MILRNVKIHRLVTLLAGQRFHETGSTALDLNLAAGFLLNVLDVVTSTANNLCSQVEAADRLQTNRELLFRPFALECHVSPEALQMMRFQCTYATELITLKVFRLTATETTLVNQVWQFLC